jgi:ligand-binding sensor domain-containing protein
MKSNPLYCVLLFASYFIYSQTDSHIFKNITAADGLSQHSVNSIIQDHQGFLWFATNDGLNKYDGYSFKVFRPDPSDTKAISGRIIQDIQVDSHGNLWIASLDGGLIHFDSKIELFTNLNSIIPDFGSYANRVSIGPDGVLWAQFQSKICYAVVRENINDMVFSSFIDKNLFSNSDQLKRLYVENNQVFFETKHTTYTLKYSKTDYTLEGIVLTPEPENNHIAQILGPEEAVWDLNKESITYRNPTLNTKISARVTNESAIIDNEGFLWCVIEDRLSVVSITDGQLQKKVVDFEYLDFLRIKNNRIKSIFFDNTGNLWVGTNGGGIYKKQIQILSLNILQKTKHPIVLMGIKSGVYTKISLGTYGSEQKVEGLVF